MRPREHLQRPFEELGTVQLPQEFKENPNTAFILAPELRAKAAALGDGIKINWHRPELSEESFKKLIDIAESELAKSGLDYHNIRHTRDGMVARLTKLLPDATIPEWGNPGHFRPVTPFEMQVTIIAGWLHDLGHCGYPYRQLQPHTDGNQSYSNEEHTAVLADEITGIYVPVFGRIMAQGLYLASSYNQDMPKNLTEDEKLIVHRPYKAHTPLEKIFCYCDVAPFMSTFAEFMENSLEVVREYPARFTPETYEDFIQSAAGFVDVIQARLEGVKPYLPHSVIEEHERVYKTFREGISALGNNQDDTRYREAFLSARAS